MNSSPVILITGATRGIGFAAARQLVARGAVVIVASRELERAEKAAGEAGGTAEPLQIDITDESSLRAAVAEIGKRHGRLDVLANNSAILLDHYESLLTLKPEVLRQTLETNLIGTFRVTRAMLPLLEKSEAPRIINVSSGAGQLDGEPQPWAPAYSMSKTALNMLTQQLTAALPRVMVNSMCPGWCRTDMGGPDAPLSPEEGADTLVWLALDAPRDLRGKFVKQRKVIPW
jgi:NAD(P)-dependent dehydrogenase (short-subunit alcohol dehydrogenase family)